MKRILVADHSPHAQRMGERILRDEGFEVATVTDGETALVRLKDLAPDVILADISLPGRDGYEICEYVKSSGKYPKTRVVLTAGPVAAVDEARAQALGSDGFVRKPFEASALLNTVQPLVEEPGAKPVPRTDLESKPLLAAAPMVQPVPAPPQPKPIDREQVRAAVILALEAAMITIIENVTDKVVVALETETQAKIPPAAQVKPAAPPPKVVAAGAPGQAPVLPGPPKAEPPKSQPGPGPDEPVVRIRTPIFRTLS